MPDLVKKFIPVWNLLQIYACIIHETNNRCLMKLTVASNWTYFLFICCDLLYILHLYSFLSYFILEDWAHMVQQLYMTNLKCAFLLSSVLDISSLKTKVKNVRVFLFWQDEKQKQNSISIFVANQISRCKKTYCDKVRPPSPGGCKRIVSNKVFIC